MSENAPGQGGTAIRPTTPRSGERPAGSTGDRPAGSASGASAESAAGGGTGTEVRKRRVRRARLRLTRIDPWSVMKTAFLLSIAFAIVTIVAVFIVWSVLGVAGVWDSINSTIADVVGEESSDGFDVQDYVGMSRVLGFTMLVAAIDVVLITAMATLGAFLYNLAAALLGGIEVTLAEEDR